MAILIYETGRRSYTIRDVNGNELKKTGRYYTNRNATANLIRYITRTRDHEDRAAELIGYGGLGISLFSNPEQNIREMEYVQSYYDFEKFGRRRMYHFILSYLPEETAWLNWDWELLYRITMEQCMVFYNKGHQVLFGIHYDPEKFLHVHFAVNAVSFTTFKKFRYYKEDSIEMGSIMNNIFIGML